MVNNAVFPIRISFNEPENIFLPKNINYSAFIPENSIPLSVIEKALNDESSGIINNFNLIELFKFYNFSPFQYEVYQQLIKIPRGKTLSYQQLAALSGNRSASRAVGSIMRINPFPILIPCHRVIKSDGTPGGFGGNPALKIALLAKEGIFFNLGTIPTNKEAH